MKNCQKKAYGLISFVPTWNFIPGLWRYLITCHFAKPMDTTKPGYSERVLWPRGGKFVAITRWTNTRLLPIRC